MKNEEKKLFYKNQEWIKEIHTAVLHPKNGLKAQMNFIVNEMSVNGDKGLLPILKSNYEMTTKTVTAVKELQEITKLEREKSERRKLIKKILELYHLSKKFDHIRKYWILYMFLGSLLGTFFKFLVPIIHFLSIYHP